jgi:hypothetical protein
MYILLYLFPLSQHTARKHSNNNTNTNTHTQTKWRTHPPVVQDSWRKLQLRHAPEHLLPTFQSLVFGDTATHNQPWKPI